MLKIKEQPKIRFRSREGFCLVSLGKGFAMLTALHASTIMWAFGACWLLGSRIVGSLRNYPNLL